MKNAVLPTVALIWGGRGYEKDVSAGGMENILPLIDENTYRVLSIHIEPDGRWTLDGEEVLLSRGGIIRDGRFIKLDCAFPLLHGDFGEDGRVQGALDCADISYVGCGTLASALCRDKSVVKAVAGSLGIPTLPYLLITMSEGIREAVFRCEEKIGYPAFVKPCNLGSSVGAMEARDRRGLLHAIKHARGYSDRILVEKCLAPKRELECGFLQAKGKELFTKCGEILCDSFYDYNKKYHSPEVKVCPVAAVGEDINRRVIDYSRRLVRALGVRELARIDFFLSGEELYFNEINTMPGMTRTSLFLKMAEASGVPEGTLINLLIEGALSR